jgi:endoglycosylceramidase
MTRHAVVTLLASSLLLLAASTPARADDAEGVWSMRTGWWWSGGEATLELLPGARARRVVSTGETLEGTWRRQGAVVLVGFPRRTGLAGALRGAPPSSPWTGLYRLAGDDLVGAFRGAWERGERLIPIVRTPARLDGRLRVDGARFVDPVGRTVLLRGVNVCRKAAPFLPAHTDADVSALARATGSGVVRLGIAWRALEPEPLRYDAAYLDGVAAAVRRFRAHGMYVLVDMHQDTWGGPFAGHGAPDWATLARDAKPLSLPDGAPWQLRYLDARVWGSFEALWSDAVVPATGLGLQEHYARAWAQVARRLAAEDGVLGYDLMNEPFFGAEAKGALVRLGLAGAPTLLRGGVVALFRSVFEGARFRGELGSELVRLARDPERFLRLTRSLGGATARVERRASAVYARVGARIQREDPDRPIFVEPTGLAGVGVTPALPRPEGVTAVVYAPHLYDAFMDSGQRWDGDTRRVARALAQHVAHARALGAPLFVGEWGNLGEDPVLAARFAHEVGALLDEAQVGATYWDHTPGAEAGLLLEAMRPYPARVAGAVARSSFDQATRRYEVVLEVDPCVAAPTVIAVPRGRYPEGLRVTASRGEAVWDEALGVILVWAGGRDVTVTLEPAP